MNAQTVPVSQVTGLRAVTITPTAVTLAWKAPARGTPPIRYTAFYRKHGSPQWSVGATGSETTATVRALHPATKYDFEILSHN